MEHSVWYFLVNIYVTGLTGGSFFTSCLKDLRANLSTGSVCVCKMTTACLLNNISLVTLHPHHPPTIPPFSKSAYFKTELTEIEVYAQVSIINTFYLGNNDHILLLLLYYYCRKCRSVKYLMFSLILRTSSQMCWNNKLQFFWKLHLKVKI